MRSRASTPALLLLLALAALGLSAIRPYDWTTWWLEVAPVVVAVPILVLSHQRFPLTPLVYWLIFAHALVLIVGGHYTYARVPLGFWMQGLFDFSRNHYDRLGHVAQGFVPAMIAREVLVRKSPLSRGGWLFFLSTCVALAVSALYELVEWWAALLGGEAANEFLGAQGDVWDTHWDMALALAGALVAQILLARIHDKQLAGLRWTFR
jgi:putative membrane protein